MKGKRQNPLYQAQAILSRRDHSEEEVRLKMKRKGFTQGQIDRAVEWLYAHKLLDDHLFARRYIESTIMLKPVGRRWLSMKLRKRGVPKSVIGESLDALLSGRKEEVLLKQAVASWKRSHPKNKDDAQPLGRFLLSRGFPSDKVFECIDEQ